MRHKSKSSLVIREALESEYDFLIEKEKENFTHDIIELSDFNDHTAIVLEIDNSIIGHYLHKGSYLFSFVIYQEYRGNRYSEMLLKHYISNNEYCYLHVNVYNNIAIHLYKKYGFSTKFLILNFYENEDPAYLMAKCT